MKLAEELRPVIRQIVDALPREELLGQISEECSELTQAAQKLRRVWAGTTDKPESQALLDLAEESADVIVCIQTLEAAGLVEWDCIERIAAYKSRRWLRRIAEYEKRDRPGAGEPDGGKNPDLPADAAAGLRL